MARDYKITSESITSYMKTKLNTYAIIGELPDSFIAQSSNGQTRQVQKREIENYAINEGFIDYGPKKQSDNYGVRVPQEAAKLKEKGLTKQQIEERYNNDPVYNAALNAMDPDTRDRYRDAMLKASDEQRVQMVKNVRDNYAEEKYNDVQYKRSTQAALDRMEADRQRINPARGNMQYGKNPTNQ